MSPFLSKFRLVKQKICQKILLWIETGWNWVLGYSRIIGSFPPWYSYCFPGYILFCILCLYFLLSGHTSVCSCVCSWPIVRLETQKIGQAEIRGTPHLQFIPYWSLPALGGSVCIFLLLAITEGGLGRERLASFVPSLGMPFHPWLSISLGFKLPDRYNSGLNVWKGF